jgi:two-component system sensor histidine kinase UhpB
MKQSLNILLLEDDEDDAESIRKCLKEGGIVFDLKLSRSKKEYLDALAHPLYDVILSDHRLGSFDSIEALRICKEKGINIPFLLVTGAIPDHYAATILREGASDYILKDRLTRLPAAIIMAIERQKMKSDKKAAEEALEESNERFELAAKASFDMICDYHLEKGTLICNEALEKNFGYTREDILHPEVFLKWIHPSDIGELRESFERMLQDDRSRWHRQFRMIRADETIAYVNGSALLLRDNDNKVYRIIGVLQDITEIVYLQNELAREKIRRQREMNETIIQAQEKEREEIGKELHDNVNQLLATAKMMIDASLTNPNMREELLRMSQDSILSAIQEIRNISHSMMPPSLKEDHFIEAIMDIVHRIEISSALTISLDLPDIEEVKEIDDKIKLTIYRIIQEQVNNILKYAQAEKASISISINKVDILLVIADNGVGFDPSVKTKGIGLKNIENRTEMLDGVMELSARPDGGCKIMVRIPLVQKEEELLLEESQTEE